MGDMMQFAWWMLMEMTTSPSRFLKKICPSASGCVLLQPSFALPCQSLSHSPAHGQTPSFCSQGPRSPCVALGLVPHVAPLRLCPALRPQALWLEHDATLGRCCLAWDEGEAWGALMQQCLEELHHVGLRGGTALQVCVFWGCGRGCAGAVGAWGEAW